MLADWQGVVKDLWALYITALDVKVVEKKVKKEKKEILDDIDELSGVSEDEQPSEDDDVTSASNLSTSGRAFRSDIQVLKKYPHFIISPLFSYLALVILKIPITLGSICG